MVSSGHDSVVRIWAPNNNKLINQISVHQKTVTKVFGDLQTNNFIHSCSIDKSLHTYDMKSDKKVNFRTLSNGSFLDMDQMNNGNLGTFLSLLYSYCGNWNANLYMGFEICSAFRCNRF